MPDAGCWIQDWIHFKAWAKKTGLRAGIPVAVGAFDAHLGAVGSGVGPGTLVKIIGTSTCDVTVAPGDRPPADIAGLCGIVNGSVLPGYYGFEAGQSAVGDIFNWFVSYIKPNGKAGTHEPLAAEALRIKPGESLEYLRKYETAESCKHEMAEPLKRTLDSWKCQLAYFTTGDPVFDDTLRQGLSVELQQSPFLSLISDRKVQQELALMGQPKEARLTAEIAQQIESIGIRFRQNNRTIATGRTWFKLM